jgi:SH3-like domain-containing protein
MRKRGVVRRLIGRSLVSLFVVGIAGAGVSFVVNGRPAAATSTLDPTLDARPAITLGKSGLPVPRFVSLKASRVNVRAGPGEDYKVAWMFTRSALPVEVIQEFDNWRRIRDSDGSVGWIFHTLLSGKRTVVVAPWATDGPRPVRASGSQTAVATAYLQPGVMAAIDSCIAGWCRLKGDGFSGWIEQTQLWGVYPGEVVE